MIRECSRALNSERLAAGMSAVRGLAHKRLHEPLRIVLDQMKATSQYELIISSTRGSVGLKGSLHRMVRW